MHFGQATEHQKQSGLPVEYDRKIKYLDYMENGERSRGAGFIKLERRGNRCNISLQVNGLYRKDHFTRPLLLMADGEERELCKLQMANGGIKTYLEGLDCRSMDGQGLAYERLTGLRIPISEGKEVLCLWGTHAGAQASRVESVAARRRQEQSEQPRDEDMQSGATQNENMRNEPSWNGNMQSEQPRDKDAQHNLARDKSVQNEPTLYQSMQGEMIWDESMRSESLRNADMQNEPSQNQDAWNEPERNQSMRREPPRSQSVWDESSQDRSMWDEPAREQSMRSELLQNESSQNESLRSESVRSEPAWNGSMRSQRTQNRNVLTQSIQNEYTRAEGAQGMPVHIGRAQNAERRESARVQPETPMPEIQILDIQKPESRKQSASRKQDATVPFKEDKWEQLWAIYPHIHPFSDEREYLSFGLSDLVVLPARYYRLVNNSFLLHGFYNFHHLILTRLNGRNGARYFIGVPGNLYQTEKDTAIMFGFENFECDREPAGKGDFGYYLIPVEL